MLKPLAIVLASCTTPTLTAQIDHFTTAPDGYDFVEGNSDSRDLLGTEPRLRYQQIDSTNRALTNRNRVAFRRDGRLFDNPAYSARTIELEWVFAESDLATISTNFSANYKTNMTVVFAKKKVSFASWIQQPPVPPAPIDNIILLDSIWHYQGKQATGNDLLWEVRVFSNDKAGQDYPFDFEYIVPNATFGYPKIPNQSSQVSLSTGCTTGSFPGPHSLQPTIFNHADKFSMAAVSSFGPTSAPTFLMIDGIDRNTSLPGLCSSLHAIAILLPMGTSDPVNGIASLAIDPIGYDPTLIGQDLFMQAVAPDANRPGIPASLSDGHRVTIPAKPQDPAIGRIWALDPTATQGTVGPLPGGIIIYTNHV